MPARIPNSLTPARNNKHRVDIDQLHGAHSISSDTFALKCVCADLQTLVHNHDDKHKDQIESIHPNPSPIIDNHFLLSLYHSLGRTSVVCVFKYQLSVPFTAVICFKFSNQNTSYRISHPHVSQMKTKTIKIVRLTLLIKLHVS